MSEEQLAQFIASNAKHCEELTAAAESQTTDAVGYCAPIFDDLLCWPRTPAGEDAVQKCPEVVAFSSQANVTKHCTLNATWFFHDTFNRFWTNYTQCQPLIDNATGFQAIDNANTSAFNYWLPKLKTLNHVGYSLSLIVLVSGMLIFLSYKKLRCARNRLHLHLFLSFALKAIVSLMKDYLFVEGIVLFSDVVVDGNNKYIKEHNFWLCKAISSSLQYFILTNYVLILMEGIYLHNLLFLALVTDKGDIHLYAALGWGIPLMFIIPWIVLKALFDDHLCWTNHPNKYLQLLIHVPIVLTIFINFILFAKIINILLIKLNIMIQQRKTKYRRLIRSTLILMPLFGVPYILSILTWFYASQNENVELFWLFFDQTFTSLQGFFVAFLYCLLNNEVRNELKKSCFHNTNSHNRNHFPLYATIITNRFSFTIDNERQNI